MLGTWSLCFLIPRVFRLCVTTPPETASHYVTCGKKGVLSRREATFTTHTRPKPTKLAKHPLINLVKKDNPTVRYKYKYDFGLYSSQLNFAKPQQRIGERAEKVG